MFPVLRATLNICIKKIGGFMKIRKLDLGNGDLFGKDLDKFA